MCIAFYHCFSVPEFSSIILSIILIFLSNSLVYNIFCYLRNYLFGFTVYSLQFLIPLWDTMENTDTVMMQMKHYIHVSGNGGRIRVEFGKSTFGGIGVDSTQLRSRFKPHYLL